MKTILVLISVLSFSALAQTVDIGSVDASDGESTTIEIHKGKKKSNRKCETQWEITDGTADLAGEPANLSKQARSSWKKICKDWKKEFRRDNKENKIISINCGIPNCTGAAGKKVCASQAAYKIKTKLN